MNEMISKFLLAQDNSMPKMQPGFTCKNYTNQSLENLKNMKYIHPLRTTFGVQI